MADAKRRVPQRIALCNSYINRTTDHLLSERDGQKVYVLLLLTKEEMDKWEKFRSDWNKLFALNQNPDTKTKTVNANLKQTRADFTAFAEPLLKRMEGSTALIKADRLILGIKERDRERTLRGAIATAPDVALTPQEGGNVRVRCRVDSDQTRASMHPLADGMELFYKIGGEPPGNEGECPDRLLSKKALFTFKAGTGNDGKRMYAYGRWVNLSEPAKNGPFSPLAIVTISAGTPEKKKES